MLSTNNTLAASSHDASTIAADVLVTCNRIPPLWDLRNYVAVNPFLGFVEQPIDAAAATVGDGLGARVLPGFDFYRAKWALGELNAAELQAAAKRLGQPASLAESVLAGVPSPEAYRTAQPFLTFAERHDLVHGTEWHETMRRWVARSCAVHITAGDAMWNPQDDRSLYVSWRESARIDRSLEIMGLHGFRAFADALPATPAAAIQLMLARVDVPASQRVAYFYRLLGGLFGFASYFRRSAWQAGNGDLGEVGDLLAILLCCDAGVVELAGASTVELSAAARPQEDEAVQLVLQEALEDRYANHLIGSLRAPAAVTGARPAVQGVFCIDVRSEPLRRHLEAQSDAIETRGFAGFFGVSLDWQTDGLSSPRCPVLLSPSVALRPRAAVSPAALNGATAYVQTAPAGAFAFVELLGLGYGLKLSADALTATPTPANDETTAPLVLEPGTDGTGVAPDTRVEMAAGILKNMGFTDRYARLILLCGHGSVSANNPHAAGLDCGACGGHGGAINARVAAALLNDPGVRTAVNSRGAAVPADTVFVPALHDTSVDEVTLLDLDRLPATHVADVDALRQWLVGAGAATRLERAPALGMNAGFNKADNKGGLFNRLRQRSRDWSEVRPEWALARNAAFIVASRQRSRDVNLGGRAFLHEYDAAADADASILTLILSAPMVVASWINLQYFASTVDNDTFGAGDKALHNRVGSLGVVLGNGGDLRTGLAKQSVHAADGSWYHEPLRLQVVVEAPRPRIEAVLAAAPSVRHLVENGWVRLFALDPASPDAFRFVPRQGWEAVAT
ncbi:MAG TPA: DUF2309 domain-containing protein [Tepidisphaeraceae bacterium]|jgi:hypothetical protein|nr:DUF2309 domain-containing protein [Tepidisphaeraceae bacterium]